MIKQIFITFTGLAISLACFSQSGYILVDSSKTTGVTIVFGNESDNWRICQVASGSGLKTYSPKELSGYGIPGYKTFVTRELMIDGQKLKVFLEQLVQGKTKLYFMRMPERRLFFIEQENGELVLLDQRKDPFTKENYRNQLYKFFNDNPEVREYAPYFSFTKNSLSQLVKMSNSGHLRPNGLNRGGLMILASGKSVFNPEEVHPYAMKVKMNRLVNVSAGLFYETGLAGDNISFRPELLFSHAVFVHNDVTDETIFDLTIKSTSMEVPLIIRYTVPAKRLRPFVNGGGTLGVQVNNQKSAYFYLLKYNSLSKLHYLKAPYSVQMDYGITGGAGIQYFFNVHRSIDLELRISKLWGNPSITSNNGIQLIASYKLF